VDAARFRTIWGRTLRRTRTFSARASQRDNRYGAPGHSHSAGSCDEIPNSEFRIPNFAAKARGYNAPSGGNEVDLTTQFEASIEKGKSLPSQGNETLLELYGLYKQATVGDVQGEAPSGFDFRGAAKYAAWEKRRGMISDEAMQAYIDLIDRLAAG
jgi:acyl-CoA-binding protein